MNQTRTPYNKNWQNYVMLASPIHLRLKALYKCFTNLLTYFPVQMWSLAGALAAHSNNTNLISNTTKFTIRQQHRRTYLPTFISSLSMVVVISAHLLIQTTRCSMHTYHSRRQKFCCRRTARVEQFTGCYYKTDHQLRTV